MYQRELDGNFYKTLLAGGLCSLKANIATVNDLNVFPIPDGDTGENMYSTLFGGVKAVSGTEEGSLGMIAGMAGDGMLMSARGNSGVILSQMFAGIARGLKGVERADAEMLAEAFAEGVRCAYASVAEPVEGTILTVLREAAEYAAANLTGESTLESYLSDYVAETERSLERTPELLPVLKEAGVIDSGGAGVLYIVKGFLSALRGEEISAAEEIAATSSSSQPDFSLFNENSVMQYGYCTEFLLQLTHAKTDVAAFSIDALKDYLATVGDSVVAFKTGTVVKVHVHTMTPGAVLTHAQAFGEFLTLKVENMTLQHSETEKNKPEREFKRNVTRKTFGVVAVASGQGITDTFRELGADIVIDGGQGKNPSVETFLRAFDAVNAEHIFVLPDNCNILMAAKEAAERYPQSDVRVIPARNMGEGYAALAALDCESGDAEIIAQNMAADISDSVSGSVARAVRDAVIGGVEVREGEFAGMSGKNMLVCRGDRVSAALELLGKLKAEEYGFIIVFYGEQVTDSDKRAFSAAVSYGYPKAEFYDMDGGQDVYDFIIVMQ